MTIEIVEFPMKNGGSFHSYVKNYQRVTHNPIIIPLSHYPTHDYPIHNP
jgi:calcineurin-like phosphoesterase family protein